MALVALTAMAQRTVVFDAATMKTDAKSITADGVTLSTSNGKLNTNEYRFYSGSATQISAEGGVITKVRFYCRYESKGAKYFTVDGKGLQLFGADGVWTGKAAEVIFNARKQVRASKVEVTVSDGDGGDTPVMPDEMEEVTIPTIVNDVNAIDKVKVLLKGTQVVGEKSTSAGKIYFLREEGYAIALHAFGQVSLNVGEVLDGSMVVSYEMKYNMPQLTAMEDTNMEQVEQRAGEKAKAVETTVEELVALKHRCDLVELKNVAIEMEERTSSDGEKVYKNYYVYGVEGDRVQLYDGPKTFDEYCDGERYDVVGLFDKIYRGQVEISPLTIVKAGAEVVTVAKPAFSVKGGVYEEAQEVAITAEEGLAIYYTTDGSEPTTKSARYEGTITVEETMTLKAIAVNADGIKSEVAEERYVLALPSPADGAIFDFVVNKWGLEYATGSDRNKGELQRLEENGVVLTTTSGTVATRLYEDFNTKHVQLRLYKGGGSLKLTAPEGNEILEVKLGFGVKHELMEQEGYDAETGVWRGKATAVEFDVLGTTQIEKIEVKLAKAVGIDEVMQGAHEAAVVYDLMGRRVDGKTYKGVVVVNGKKYMLR